MEWVPKFFTVVWKGVQLSCFWVKWGNTEEPANGISTSSKSPVWLVSLKRGEKTNSKPNTKTKARVHLQQSLNLGEAQAVWLHASNAVCYVLVSCCKNQVIWKAGKNWRQRSLWSWSSKDREAEARPAQVTLSDWWSSLSSPANLNYFCGLNPVQSFSDCWVHTTTPQTPDTLIIVFLFCFP